MKTQKVPFHSIRLNWGFQIIDSDKNVIMAIEGNTPDPRSDLNAEGLAKAMVALSEIIAEQPKPKTPYGKRIVELADNALSTILSWVKP